MQLWRKETSFDFMSKRKLALMLSVALIVISLLSLIVRGLAFGIDFTGGTLVEVRYNESVAVADVRATLDGANIGDSVVQYFGTSRDILVRLPAEDEGAISGASTNVMEALRAPFNETLNDDAGIKAGLQQCSAAGAVADCNVQMRRVEFVGPQVGEELTNDGGIAMLIALVCILIYVWLRFEWKFAVGAVAALAHDVIITLGLFSIFQFEFSLPVLAAVLAVIGYSLNDTIVVYDRIRENFRRMRKGGVVDIMNTSINQTLPRTVLTSLTTLFVVVTLLVAGGEVIRGFSIALLIGVVVGTYSSIFVASPVVLALGISREEMLPVQKEGAEQVDLMP